MPSELAPASLAFASVLVLTRAHVPKNNSLSKGGGKSYLFSKLALPVFLPQSDTLYFSFVPFIVSDHVCRHKKSSFTRNPHFLYNVSKDTSLVFNVLIVPFVSIKTMETACMACCAWAGCSCFACACVCSASASACSFACAGFACAGFACAGFALGFFSFGAFIGSAIACSLGACSASACTCSACCALGAFFGAILFIFISKIGLNSLPLFIIKEDADLYCI